MYQFQAFNLKVHSDLFFPELLPMPSLISDAEILIQYGFVDPQGLHNPNQKGAFFQTADQTIWLNIPSVARFMISQGRFITIDPTKGIDEDSIRVFVLGSCLGALLMQRGYFLLHGNAVQIGQHAMSFTGMSGAGKSTLSAIFFKRGYAILADDICAINPQGEVIPSFPQIKLWADAAKHLAIDTTLASKIRPNIEKYAIPLADKFKQTPLPLKMLYVLKPHNLERFVITTITGVQKIAELREQLYRPTYMKSLSNHRRHHLQYGQLAQQTAVAHLNRPLTGYQFDELANTIELDLAERGL